MTENRRKIRGQAAEIERLRSELLLRDVTVIPEKDAEYVRVRAERNEHLAEIVKLRLRIASLVEALGLLSTLAPSMQIDLRDPERMAREIEAVVRQRTADEITEAKQLRAERDELRGRLARLEECKKP